MSARYRRMVEIEAWLANHPQAPDNLLIAPFDELGRLLFDLGDYDAALAHWREKELPLHRSHGDDRGVAITQGQIADILIARGQLDEALRIYREKKGLPVYERLGDLRAKAVTQAKIGLQIHDGDGVQAAEAKQLLDAADADPSHMGLL